MRFLSIPVLTFALFINATAFAAVSADQWQSQLQSEVARLTAMSPDIKAQGSVAVTEQDGQLNAILPSMMVTSPDKSQWLVPSIIMKSTSGGAVTITLPSTITRYNASKAEIAKMVLGTQSLNGNWNFSGNYFETLNGNVKNVSFNDTIARSKTNVGNVALSATKSAQVEFVTSDIKNVTVKEGKQLSSAANKVTIAYQFSEGNHLTLGRLIGLFNPAILLADSQPVTLTATANQLSATDNSGRTTSIEKTVTTLKLQPKGKIVSAQSTSQIYAVRQSPESAYSFLLPQKLETVASIADLPLELISFAPGMSFSMAKDIMAKSGTVIDVQKMALTTYDQGTLNGYGKLKANSNVPSGFVGRFTLSINNLKQLISTMQMQLLQPDNGVSRSAKTQGLMIAMMLQGMGKQNGANTEFVVDMTPEGQILVNGQDFSGLTGAGKGGAGVPAIPTTPVTGSDL